MMSELSWSPEEFLRRLQGHLTWARVRRKLHTLVFKSRRDDETRQSLEVARLFFLMAEQAFYTDAALTVYKLMSKKEDRSIVKYLNKSIHDLNRIDYPGDPLTRSDLERHLSKIKSFEGKMDRLETLRNEWLAHHDSSAFDDPDSFLSEYYVKPNELDDMISCAQSILERHYLAFGSDFSPGLSRETDFLSIVDILKRYHEAHKMRFQDPSDLEKAVDLMFHHRHSNIEELRSKFLDEEGA